MCNVGKTISNIASPQTISSLGNLATNYLTGGSVGLSGGGSPDLMSGISEQTLGYVTGNTQREKADQASQDAINDAAAAQTAQIAETAAEKATADRQASQQAGALRSSAATQSLSSLGFNAQAFLPASGNSGQDFLGL